MAWACFGKVPDTPGLRSYRLKTEHQRWQLTICYPRERTLTPAEQDFVQAAKEYYREKQ